MENKSQKNINIVLSKWLHLQKVTKEGITLQDIIKKQKTSNQEAIINSYSEFYMNKLKTRETLETALSIDNDSEASCAFELSTSAESMLGEAYLPTIRLFQTLRNNFQYIVKIAGLMEMNIEDTEINSIVDLFCHQFYENILIPNPEHEELLILCYLLLEQQISSMTTVSVSSFIDEASTFIGKFLKSYSKKQELKTYLSMTLGSIILNVENSGEYCMEINPIKIIKKLDNWEISSEGIDTLFERKNNLKKPTGSFNVQFKKPSALNPSLLSSVPSSSANAHDVSYSSSSSQLNRSSDVLSIKEFVEQLNKKELLKRIGNEKDENLREFYKKQFERINRDNDIFTNKRFLESVSHLKESEQIIAKYIKGFKKIKLLINNIIKSLISNVSTIPYTLRCICKVICILIQRKFPLISPYERNGFIGEFIFGKCILPILVNSDINAVITSSILSGNIRECLKIASKVLIKISRGVFFDSTIDINLTIFNHFIIDVIPDMNRFYNELIQVELPHVLNKLVTGEIDYNRIEKYNYFDENNEELLNIQCVCFSIQDILLLIKYIKPEIDKAFKPREGDDALKAKDILFLKTINKLIGSEKFLIEQAKKSSHRLFFISHNTEENPYKKELLGSTEEKVGFFTDKELDKTDLVLNKIKKSIIVILRGLNLINNRVYSYLNQANSNHNFFISINQTLQAEEYSVNSQADAIPLNWYSLYMISNLQNLDVKYKEGDYFKLYTEILEDELKKIDFLKAQSNLIITKYGMNIRCSENLLLKTRMDFDRALKIEKIIKTKKFISKAVIKVCVRSTNDSFIEEERNKLILAKKIKTKKTDKSIDSSKTGDSLKIIVDTVYKCIHSDMENFFETSKIAKIFSGHLTRIKDFIKLFEDFPEVREDVLAGEQQVNNIAKSLSTYLDIVQGVMEKDELFKEEALAKKKKDQQENEVEEILEKIKNYIHKRIYPKVFPEHQSQQDYDFHQQTLLLSWVTPENLEIKKIFLNEKLWDLAVGSINKLDEEKTPFEKINCIENACFIINRTIKFCSGSDKEVGADELTPMLQYIIIRAQPKRFFSNINYILGICDNTNEKDAHKGRREFYIKQIEGAAQFINGANYQSLKVSEEEYNRKVQEKADEYNIKLAQ